MENILKDIIQPVIVSICALFALYQYNKQQQFKRFQNLIALWKEFRTNNNYSNLFGLMDSIALSHKDAIELANYSADQKLQYLALLEEVTLYLISYEVDFLKTYYLFQWHLKYVYTESETNKAFWNNMW